MPLEITVSRRDIEARLASVGDYVKMDYLQACLKKQLDFDTKKFVLIKLSEIYESRKIFAEAGKMMRNAAEINATFDGKMQDFMKSVELFIRGGVFEEAEISFTKALGCSTELQKQRIKSRRKELYFMQARDFLAKDKRKHAMETFEMLLTLPELAPAERQEAQQALLKLYEKLGRIKEFYNLQHSMNKPAQQQLRQSRLDTPDNLFRELGI